MQVARNSNEFVEYGKICDWDFFQEYVKPKFRGELEPYYYRNVSMGDVEDTDLETLVEVYCLKNNWRKQYGLVRIPENKEGLNYPYFIIDDNYYVTSNIYINEKDYSIVLPLYRMKHIRDTKRDAIVKAYKERKNRIYNKYTNKIIVNHLHIDTTYILKIITKYTNYII